MTAQPKKQLTGIAEAIAQTGSMSNLAKELGVTYQAIQLWQRQGYVPIRRVTEMEARYGIARERLVHPRYLESLTPVDFKSEA